MYKIFLILLIVLSVSCTKPVVERESTVIAATIIDYIIAFVWVFICTSLMSCCDEVFSFKQTRILFIWSIISLFISTAIIICTTLQISDTWNTVMVLISFIPNVMNVLIVLFIYLIKWINYRRAQIAYEYDL